MNIHPHGSRVKAVVTGAALIVAALVGAAFASHPRHVTLIDRGVSETIYIRNLSPQDISDATIINDIPAWQAMLNEDFAPYWHTAQFRLVFVGRAEVPAGQMVATFVKKGPVKGALAYHTVDRGAPAIVVYAGTGNFYGFDNSVSMTHELEELAADPTICVTNQGWPADWIWYGDTRRIPAAEGLVWAQEVSDPVEAYSYLRSGADGSPVKISDFVTPDWFNDESGNDRYDFMRLIHQPLSILPGGYAQAYDGLQWNVFTNFRSGVPSDNGFLKGEDLSPVRG